MKALLKKLIKKIKQAHCEHDWQRGFIEMIMSRTVMAGELVSTDDGVYKGRRKRCKKCEKYETDEDVKVFGQIIGYAK